MSHAGADDGKGDVVVACGSGPAMARGVGGEAERLADERAQLFQLLVVVVQSCLVLPVGLFGVGRRDDGEDVGTVGAGGQVAFQDAVDARLDAQCQALTGLVAVVGDGAVGDIRFFQISHVDECHATRTVTEYEEVSCKEQGRVTGQVEPLQLEDGLFADCPFGGRGDAGVDLGERVGLFGQFFAYGLVVGGAQDAHVERAAVAPDVALGQPLLVPADEGGVYGGEGDIGAFQKGGEAAQGAPVVAGGAILVVVLKPEDFFLQILQYAVGSQVGLEEADDIGQGVGLDGGVQLSDDFAQFVYVLFDLSAVGRDGGGVVGCGDQFAFLRVPPVGEDPHGGGNLFVFLSVAKLVADRSCFPVDRRRAEFYFDCCHTILFLGFTLRS